MKKAKTVYICTECQKTSMQWAGKCNSCGSWNTLQEDVQYGNTNPASLTESGPLIFTKMNSTPQKLDRIDSGFSELNRVLGGGIVPGSATLIGGDPGIGKSTLLLQMASLLSSSVTVLYISGEESEDQIKMRAARLGLENSTVSLASNNNVIAICHAIRSQTEQTIVIIDSIQTMSMDTLDSSAGTVSQVKACAAELIKAAKSNNVALFIVGHVTKDGQIAGPKILEHAVDCVIDFIGDNNHDYRLLRANKNRFGPTDEVAVFSMTENGLEEVKNPSEIFLSDDRGETSGSSVFPCIEGTRPLLVEIQALVAPTTYGSPRRTVVGWDYNRLTMILAVLESRCGISFSQSDVYLNIVGGYKINEPAADLSVAAALLSAKLGKPLPHDLIVFGEIGLGGEIRPVRNAENRIKEAQKLGFTLCVMPSPKPNQKPFTPTLKTLMQKRCLTLAQWIENL